MKALDDITEKILSENLLTESEQQALANAVQMNGPDCPEMKKLYEVYGSIVEAVAQEYIHNDIAYDELLAAARKGFEYAINRYHSPVPLAHFAVWDIRRFIHEAMASKVAAKPSK